MPRDKYEYDQQYLKEHIFTKRIPFNNTKQEDVEMLEWINKQGNTTQYIKALVREDMERRKVKT